MKQLWVEKYRPTSLNDYVFKDESQKDQILNWIKNKSIPNLLLTGSAGIGKTTLARVLLHELEVDWGDVLEINASANNGIDYIRDSVINFVSSMPFGEFKYVLLDEADFLSAQSQAALRNAMESYSSTARFILTGNYVNKIIPAIQSRCHSLAIETLNKEEFTVRLATILATEEVDFDLDTLDDYVSISYPDMRKCINRLQSNSISGVLKPVEDTSGNTSDYRLAAISLFRDRKYKEARELICGQIGQEEYEDMFRFMYQNLSFWADSEEKVKQAIITIRNGLVKHTTCADSEINLSATLVELELVALS